MCYTADINMSLVPSRHLKGSFFNSSRQLQKPQVTNILFRQRLRILHQKERNRTVNIDQLLLNFWLHQKMC